MRKGIGVGPATCIRTGKRCGRRTQSMVWSTAGNKAVLVLPAPSATKMPHPRCEPRPGRVDLLAHQRDPCFLADLDVRQLGFFEVTSDPERARVDQGHQLIARRHVGPWAGVQVRDATLHRSHDLGVTEV